MEMARNGSTLCRAERRRPSTRCTVCFHTLRTAATVPSLGPS
jgi:hypothetical protein